MKTFSLAFAGGEIGIDASVPLLVTAPGESEVEDRWQSPFTGAELSELAAEAICFGPENLDRAPTFRDVAVAGAAVDPELIGRRLYASLFTPVVAELWQRSIGLRKAGPNLRLELVFDPAKPGQVLLYSLPWELLHDGNSFLALSGRPIVRRLRIPHAIHDPLRVDRLRILAAVLSSRNLDVERELGFLGQVAEKSPAFVFEIVREPRLPDLRRQLKEGGFHGLHLIGHGKFDAASGGWGLESAEGFLAAPELALQLAGDLPLLRLVVLNACRTGRAVGPNAVAAAAAGVATALVLGGVPAVVAMQAPISDPAAHRLPFALYQHLAREGDLAAAVGDARLDLAHAVREGAVPGEWAVPVQLERSRGRLFEIAAPPEAPLALRAKFALAAVAASAALLAFQAYLWLMHPPQLQTAALAVAGAAAAAAWPLLSRLNETAREQGRPGVFASLGGWLAGRRRRFWLAVFSPAVAALLLATSGAARLAELPCLEAAPPGSDLSKLVGLTVGAGWEGPFGGELRDLVLRQGLEPVDLASLAAGDLPASCYRYRIAARSREDGAPAEVEVHRYGRALPAIVEPAGEPAAVARGILRRLEALLGDAGAPARPALEPGSASYAANALALRLYAAGELERAIEVLSAAVAQDGDEPILRNNLAQLLAELGERQKNAAAVLPEGDQEARDLALAAAREAWREARAQLGMALLAEPGQPRYAYNRGRVAQRLGDPAAARRDFAAALAIWPTFPEAANDLALLDLEEGRPGDAAERLTEALRWSAEPATRAALLKNLGRARQDLGELSAAAAALEQALALAPAANLELRAAALARLAAIHAELLGPASACVTWRRYEAALAGRPDPDAGRRADHSRWAGTCGAAPGG